MVDSINLKKRILKMREEHNSKNNETNLNSSLKKYEQDNPLNKNSLFSNSDISSKNIFDNKNIINDEKPNFSSLQNYNNEKLNNYDEQFKVLANKFNEAIEVILELSESVNKLENTIYSKKEELNKRKYSNNRYKLKLIIFIIFISLVLFNLLYLPVDLKPVRLFLSEILSILQ